jgi:hypothetical protein
VLVRLVQIDGCWARSWILCQLGGLYRSFCRASKRLARRSLSISTLPLLTRADLMSTSPLAHSSTLTKLSLAPAQASSSPAPSPPSSSFMKRPPKAPGPPQSMVRRATLRAKKVVPQKTRSELSSATPTTSAPSPSPPREAKTPFQPSSPLTTNVRLPNRSAPRRLETRDGVRVVRRARG